MNLASWTTRPRRRSCTSRIVCATDSPEDSAFGVRQVRSSPYSRSLKSGSRIWPRRGPIRNSSQTVPARRSFTSHPSSVRASLVGFISNASKAGSAQSRRLLRSLRGIWSGPEQRAQDPAEGPAGDPAAHRPPEDRTDVAHPPGESVEPGPDLHPSTSTTSKLLRPKPAPW